MAEYKVKKFRDRANALNDGFEHEERSEVAVCRQMRLESWMNRRKSRGTWLRDRVIIL